ncbi:MAG: hypothetical protein R2778_11045 [Saprospiraceae bacterium]
MNVEKLRHHRIRIFVELRCAEPFLYNTSERSGYSIEHSAVNFTHQVNGTTGLQLNSNRKLPAGATVADNTTIFAPCFTAIGAPNTAYPITFGTSACPNPTPFATLNAISGEQYRMEDGGTDQIGNGPQWLLHRMPFAR